MYLFAASLPGIAIFIGGLLYFALFPQDLDLGAHNLIAQYSAYGAPESLHGAVLLLWKMPGATKVEFSQV